MHRTQIYLNSDERSGLEQLMAQSNKSMSFLIREALYEYLCHNTSSSFSQILCASKGCFNEVDYSREEWENRDSRLNDADQ